MKKQMITLAMTMLLGSTSVFGGTTSVQAAETQEYAIYNGADQTIEVADQIAGRGIFSSHYEVVVAKTSIKKSASSSSKTIGTAYKGNVYQKEGENGNWIKIIYRSGYGYINKSALKKV